MSGFTSLGVLLLSRLSITIFVFVYSFWCYLIKQMRFFRSTHLLKCINLLKQPFEPRDIWILVPQKTGFSRQDLEGTYISEMALKRTLLKEFFAILWEWTLIMIQSLKIFWCQILWSLTRKNFQITKIWNFGSVA